MNAADLTIKMKALRDDIGPRADVSLSLALYRETPTATCYVYPNGLADIANFYGAGDTFDAAIEDARTQWESVSADHRRATIKKMALAIISITADTGECTDAGLRADGFSQSEIDKLGSDAVARATEMAGSGPFSIRTVVGANEAAW